MKKWQTTVLSILVIILQIANVSCTKKQNNSGVAPNSSKSAVEKINVVKKSSTDVNFVTAAKIIMPAVVHIKIHFNGSSEYGASGSGVIIDSEGFIATNNHVVENSSAIEVILSDKRTFSAKLVGRDPNTDLALVKIDANNLPVAIFGNSDQVEIGEWVLAVGFPLSLNTTVTAGIVSAKARSIGIINRQKDDNRQTNTPFVNNRAVESFIQTDAAINPGNSGGALVNTSGELIGINSAIASQTGSYAGYSFAIPINLAKKILDDLKVFGRVNRGVLGVSFPAPSTEDEYLKKLGLNPALVKGIYITGVQNGGAADVAGLKEGDIIQRIDGIVLNSSTAFSERIARHKPNDNIKLSILRKGKSTQVTVTLKSEDLTKNKNNGILREIYDRLGANFAPLTADVKQHFNINSGVLVTKVRKDGFFGQVGILPGTIIAFINSKPINNPKDIDSALIGAQSGIVQILAIAPDGSKVVFNFSLGT